MKCPKDQTHEVIENYAGGDKFFYCRGCKDEVKQLADKRADSDLSYNSMYNLFVDNLRNAKTVFSSMNKVQDLIATFYRPGSVYEPRSGYSPLPGAFAPKTVFSRLEKVLTNELMVQDNIRKINLNIADFAELKKEGRFYTGYYMNINNCYIEYIEVSQDSILLPGTLCYYIASSGIVIHKLLNY